MREVDPVDTILQIAGGHVVPRSLHVVAELGVADALDETPRTARDLAESVGADPDALDRLLRLLSAYGVFESRSGAYAHTAASRLLRSDHPQSMRAVVRMFGLPILWTISGALGDSARSGAPATPSVLPQGLWEYIARNPDESRIFNAAMTAKAHGQIAGVLAAYDFSGFDVVVDVGGGRGHLLRAVLEAAPKANGVLFDLPHVIREEEGLASERLSLAPGDFFQDPLPTGDAYLLMEVIHDWDDERSVAILRAIRKAAPSHAKLLLIEQLIPPGDGPNWAKTLDIHMLFLLGGRQRTRDEYEVLLRDAGFALQREIDAPGGVSILEATPA
ncbi:MAG TPA: methyltransferase [Gemmatimonadota bacterium]|nr:methyltransferase [Gemmatimonadota bacterium]